MLYCHVINGSPRIKTDQKIVLFNLFRAYLRNCSYNLDFTESIFKYALILLIEVVNYIFLLLLYQAYS